MPVDERPEVLEVVRTAVLVVEVVGVLLDVDGQQRRQAMTERVIAVLQRQDTQVAIGAHRQENPARTEEQAGGLVHLFDHRAERAKRLFDEQHELARRLLGVVRRGELFEEELVVEHLAGIVGEGSCGRFAHEVAEGHALVLGVLHQLVEFVDVVLEVLAVVVGEGLSAHHRRQVA